MRANPPAAAGFGGITESATRDGVISLLVKGVQGYIRMGHTKEIPDPGIVPGRGGIQVFARPSLRRFAAGIALLCAGLAAAGMPIPRADSSPPKLLSDFAPLGSAIRFVDIAEAAGVVARNFWGGEIKKRFILETKGNGVAFLDFDRDGWLDIYLSNGTRLEDPPTNPPPTPHLYRNQRDGTFSDVTQASGLALTGWQTGVCAGDYDNDGWEDLLLTYWGQNRLLRNEGNGTFKDVTPRAGLTQSRVRWGTGCNFLDFDLDGNLDIYITNYIEFDPAEASEPGSKPSCMWKGMPVLCGPRGLAPGRNVLFRNLGNGTFQDVSESSGVGKYGGNGLGSVSYDFDSDGWPDIYVANDSTPSLLYRNNHDGTFSEIAQKAGVAYSDDGYEQGGMGLAVGDYDGDGWLDIFKTNFADDIPNLYRNNGDGTFADQVLAAGLGSLIEFVSWGAGFVDVDNDGRKDILYVNGHVYPEVDLYRMDSSYRQPRLLYRNLGSGRFQNVSAESGPAFQQKFSSRGSAYGDFDNDGRVDVVITNMNDRPSLWHNESRTRNHSLLIKLEGKRTNRSAIGARVRVVAGTGSQVDEVHSGDSLMSMSDLRLHFGLGTASKTDLLEVHWPASGIVEQFKDVTADQILTIREGEGIVRRTPYEPAR